MSTAIIFGANGQDGYYLTALLRNEGVHVIGVSRSGGFDTVALNDFHAVSAFIQQHNPAYIFHLAANSTTRHDALFENHETIVTGTLNILEAVRLYTPNAKVFISGSGLQFENHGNPICETDPFEARDPYAVSRIQSVYTARYYQKLGLQVYVGYFFNHDSPRRTERHMAQKIAQAAKRIGAGSNENLEIGDLEAIKEWTYAGDIVEGIWLFMNQNKIMEANIASGKGFSIKEWTDICFQLVNKNYLDHVVENKDFISPYHSLVADVTRIKSMGFEPKVDFFQLAKMMVCGE